MALLLATATEILIPVIVLIILVIIMCYVL